MLTDDGVALQCGSDLERSAREMKSGALADVRAKRREEECEWSLSGQLSIELISELSEKAGLFAVRAALAQMGSAGGGALLRAQRRRSIECGSRSDEVVAPASRGDASPLCSSSSHLLPPARCVAGASHAAAALSLCIAPPLSTHHRRLLHSHCTRADPTCIQSLGRGHRCRLCSLSWQVCRMAAMRQRRRRRGMHRQDRLQASSTPGRTRQRDDCWTRCSPISIPAKRSTMQARRTILRAATRSFLAAETHGFSSSHVSADPARRPLRLNQRRLRTCRQVGLNSQRELQGSQRQPATQLHRCRLLQLLQRQRQSA